MKFGTDSLKPKSSGRFTNLSVRITQEDVGYTVRVRLYSHAAPVNNAWGEELAEVLEAASMMVRICRRVFDFGGTDQD